MFSFSRGWVKNEELGKYVYTTEYILVFVYFQTNKSIFDITIQTKYSTKRPVQFDLLDALFQHTYSWGIKGFNTP